MRRVLVLTRVRKLSRMCAAITLFLKLSCCLTVLRVRFGLLTPPPRQQQCTMAWRRWAMRWAATRATECATCSDGRSVVQSYRWQMAAACGLHTRGKVGCRVLWNREHKRSLIFRIERESEGDKGEHKGGNIPSFRN